MMRKTIFQFFHWYYPKEKKLWKEVAEQASHLQWLGISDVWLPPPYKSSAGDNGVGYDVYDLFDLGEFNQKGTVRTKYGTKEELINAVDAAHEAGLKVYADIVVNHLGGADEAEKIFVKRVNPDNRNEFTSDAS